MDTTLTLHAARGPLAGREFRLAAPTRCIIGRAQDCDLILPDTPPARIASRHHCQLEITSAGAVVRDFGSRNGTYVNRARIGRRSADQKSPGWPFAEGSHRLANGDELRVGDSVFQVIIADAETRAAEAGMLCAAVN